jgi:vacuolar-type H+-ATPase subunit H
MARPLARGVYDSTVGPPLSGASARMRRVMSLDLAPAQSLAIGFALMTLLGAIILATPLAAQGQRVPFIDALFTANSAITTTGLITVDTRASRDASPSATSREKSSSARRPSGVLLSFVAAISAQELRQARDSWVFRGGPMHKGVTMTAKGGQADENLLELIASKERELETRVAQARDEARRLVEGAQARAAALQEQARREAAGLAEQMQAEITRERDALVAQRAGAARAEADRVRSRAVERAPQAVDLVVKRVLGGLD